MLTLRARAVVPASRPRRPLPIAAPTPTCLLPPEDTLSPGRKEASGAIREFSDLGSGFRVAALDLEIAAREFLGGEQSGHIEAVASICT